MLSEERKSTIISTVADLIRHRSYSGEEDGVAAALEGAMRAQGFDDVTVDRYGNVVGVIRGNRPGPKVLFDGHMDTVVVSDVSEWSHDPFAAEIVDGRMYGRGTSDMKGALGAMTCAAGFFAADSARDFAGEVYVAGIVHEECFEGVAAREVAKNVRPDVVVIGESSNLDLKVGQRGRAEIVVETHGVSCHSANPEKGVNAVYAMSKLIPRIRQIVPPEQDRLGKGILELTDIKSSPYPGASVVPDRCRATFDRRLLVDETPEDVIAPIKEAIVKLEAEDPEVRAEVYYAHGEERCYTGETIESDRFFPGWLYSEDEPFVADTLAELRSSGFDPGVRVYNFCTNGSSYAGEAHIKTLGLGPSQENLAHTVDEYVELDQLTGAAACYMAIMRALCK